MRADEEVYWIRLSQCPLIGDLDGKVHRAISDGASVVLMLDLSRLMLDQDVVIAYEHGISELRQAARSGYIQLRITTPGLEYLVKYLRLVPQSL